MAQTKNNKATTTTKKSTTNHKGVKKTSKTPSKTKNSTGYQSFYLIVGLLIIFLSLIAIFNWGYLGIMLANGFRLLVGETYRLCLIALMALATYMCWKGEVFPVQLKRWIGFFLILVTVTGFLHFEVFHEWMKSHPQLSIFDVTFETYRQQVLTSDLSKSLAGGMLGAGIYANFSYLFGKWGSYLLFVILLFIGGFCLLDLPFQLTVNALQTTVRQLVKLKNNLFPDLTSKPTKRDESTVPEISNSESYQGRVPATDHQQMTLSFDTDEPSQDMDDYIDLRNGSLEKEPASHQNFTAGLESQTNASPRNLWQKMQDFFLGYSEEDYGRPTSTNQRSSLSQRVGGQERHSLDLNQQDQPVFQADPSYEFKPYTQQDPLANTAQSKRQASDLSEKILDLDFFDQLNQSTQAGTNTLASDQKSPSLQIKVAGKLNSLLNEDNAPRDIEIPRTKLTETQTKPEINQYQASEQEAQFELDQVNKSKNINEAHSSDSYQAQESGVDFEADSTNLFNDEIESQPHESSEKKEEFSLPKGSSHATATKWQDQAGSSQALTDDEVDKLLQSSEVASDHKTKSPATSKSSSQAYKFPGKDLLKVLPPVDQSEEYQRINDNIEKLQVTFESFGVDAKIVKANLGPSVTKYEIQPAIGVKVSKIVSLSDDIALALAARDVRIEAPIPGKSLIGIEVPNNKVSPVAFSEIIDAGLASPNLLEVPLGRDISGSVCLADLSKMPHLLVAGATGSGKSVGINVIICSLLMKAKPEEVKFLMVDPKKVELTLYNDLPHLLAPVVTNPRKAARALNNVVEEMERRYELFSATGVRNLDSYNEQVDTWNAQEGTGYKKLPKIVVFIDELADLMMVASNDVENAIIRLAQMARAAGIHMIIATQRPSVDVITGIIKANVPSRLAFAVSSGTDSRTILDSNGAEKLLGRGDMLFQPMGKNKPVRVQGAYISDEEVERITDFIKDQRTVEYDETIIVPEDDSTALFGEPEDEFFNDAVMLIQDQETVSISQLQRRFRIGYNRAARLIDELEAKGLVSAQDGSKPRQVLLDSVNTD